MNKKGDIAAEKKPSEKISVEEVIARLGLLFAGVYGLGQGFQLWAKGSVFIHSEMLVFSLLCYLAGFTCLALAVLYTKKMQGASGWAVAGLLLLSTFARGYNHLRYVNPQYGTDAVAFNHYAAELTLKGANPYKASMAAASERFGVPKKYYTPDDRGRVVRELSYPAHSFLIYVPFIAAGGNNINWVNLGAHLAAILLLLLLLPLWIRPLALGVFMFEPELINFTVGGVTDICFVPLLIGAAYTWRTKRTLSAVLWGLACGIKQGPWFLAPFFFVAVYHETSRAGLKAWLMEEAKFFGPAAAAFLIPNLPFLLMAPTTWFGGVFTPMGRKLVLYGSGLVNLTTSGGIPLHRTAYTLLALSVWSALTAVYSLFYRKMAPMLWIFPGIILWLTPRAFHSYYIYWAPMFVVALAWWLQDRIQDKAPGPKPDTKPNLRNESDQQTDSEKQPSGSPDKQKNAKKAAHIGLKGKALFVFTVLISRLRTRTGVAVLLGLPFFLFGIAALTASVSSRTLKAEVVEISDPNKLGIVEQLKIRVENRTGRKTTPKFALLWRGNNLFFWKAEGGALPLRPDEHRVITLHPRNHTEAPPLDEPFRIRVYDENSSVFHLTPVSGPHPRTALLYNRHLSHWDEVSKAPISWTRSPRAVTNPEALVRKAHKGREVTCLHTMQDGSRPWSRTSLSQDVPKGVRTLSFTYASPGEPVGGHEPIQLLGLELEFPRGEIAIISPSSTTPIPLIVRRNHYLFIRLPYSGSNQWETFRVDSRSLARELGYAYTPEMSVRLIVNRHRKMPGDVMICIDEISVSPNEHLGAFSAKDMDALDNTGLLHWNPKGDRPLGWSIEPPSSMVDYRVALDGPGGASLEITTGGDKSPSPSEETKTERNAPGETKKGTKSSFPEWSRLAVSQRLFKAAKKIEVLVCSREATKNPSKPKYLAGLEITDGETTGVWTLSENKDNKLSNNGPIKKGTVHIHPVPTQQGIGCAKMTIHPGRLGLPGNKVSLLLNIHKSKIHRRKGTHEVRFGPIKVYSH